MKAFKSVLFFLFEADVRNNFFVAPLQPKNICDLQACNLFFPSSLEVSLEHSFEISFQYCHQTFIIIFSYQIIESKRRKQELLSEIWVSMNQTVHHDNGKKDTVQVELNLLR